MKNLKEIKFMMERLETPRMTYTQYEKKHKKLLKEGIGTGILILTGIGVAYLGRKIKNFVDKYAKYLSSVQLISFLSKIKSIEGGEEEGKVVVKEDGNYTFITIVIDGKVFDSLTIDTVNDSIYSGHNKQPKTSDMIIPRQLPYDADTENMEEIKQAEQILVDSILEIIIKYGKKKNEE